MYYETRTHKLTPVADAMEAAKKIKSEHRLSYEALNWQSSNGNFIVVADGHVDNEFLEMAFIRVEPDGTYKQTESITAGWIKTAEELGKYFLEAETEPGIVSHTTSLIIDNPKGDELAWFDCGCCGTSFQGNVKYQHGFAQDTGYGICKSCEHYYQRYE